ncbi:hypothetical protein QBC39DRAFT_338229 [Podospora conica]|nr:hypothetical protein QBC39DRAFT_338229 [Schizothecium conicum]
MPESRTTPHQALPGSGPTLLSIQHSGENPARCRPSEAVSLDTQAHLNVASNLLTPPLCYTAKAYLCTPFLAGLDEAPPLVPRLCSTFHVAGKMGWNEGSWHPSLRACAPSGCLKGALPPVIGVEQTRDADICVEKRRFGQLSDRSGACVRTWRRLDACLRNGGEAERHFVSWSGSIRRVKLVDSRGSERQQTVAGSSEGVVYSQVSLVFVVRRF